MEKISATFGFHRTFSSSKSRTSPILFPLAESVSEQIAEMKKTFFIFLFLILGLTKIFACKCGSFGSIGENYSNSDIIGEISILKIYDSNSKNRTYKVDISFQKIYKGSEIKTLTAEGVIGDIYTPACEIELNVGEKYLIYLSKHGNKYFVSACTPKFLIGNKDEVYNYKSVDLQRLALNYLKKNPQNFDFVFYFDDSMLNGDKSSFSKLDKITPTNQFAIYKLKVDEKSRVSSISVISKFGEVDNEVENLIQKNFTIVKGFMEEVKNKEVLLLMFYIPENENKEFKETITNNLDE